MLRAVHFSDFNLTQHVQPPSSCSSAAGFSTACRDKQTYPTQSHQHMSDLPDVTLPCPCSVNCTYTDSTARDAKGYGRYICAILSRAVLIFGLWTDRNRNRGHCAVRSVLLILWSKHRSDSRVLLTIYQDNNPLILHH